MGCLLELLALLIEVVVGLAGLLRRGDRKPARSAAERRRIRLEKRAARRAERRR